MHKPFYGWYIVGVAFLSLFVGMGGGGFTFSVFLPAMSADLGWSRSTLVGAGSLGMITGSILGPLIGRFVDHHGARLVLGLAVVGTSASCLAVALCTSPWQFYLAFGVLGGTCGSVMLNVGPGTMIANWFVRRRAVAFGIAAMGPPSSALVFPPMAAAIGASYGWRVGWMVIAFLVIAVALAPVLLLVRRRPEDMGLRPDGDPPVLPEEADGPKGSGWSAANDWTFQEAVHSTGFWLVAVSMALITVVPNMLTFFLFSYFLDQGLGDTAAAATISFLSLTQVASRILLWTPLVARLGSVRWAVMLWGGMLLGGTLLLLVSRGATQAYVASGVLGLAMGGNMVVMLQIWPEYFGRTAIGSITGMAQMVQGLAGATAPVVGAFLLDATNSYTGLFGVVAGMAAIGLAIQLVIGKPKRRRPTLQHPPVAVEPLL